MLPDVSRIVREALERFLNGTDPREESFRRLASFHKALPIFPDWTGFIGLTEEGHLLWISEEGSSKQPNAYERHLALLRAGELFPELAFLRPQPGPDWVDCSSCHGTGKVVIDGVPVPGNIRCRCGNVGRLPRDLA